MRAASKRKPSLLIDSAWGCGCIASGNFQQPFPASDKCRIPRRHGVRTASIAPESGTARSVTADMWLRSVFVKNNFNYKNYEQQNCVSIF